LIDCFRDLTRADVTDVTDVPTEDFENGFGAIKGFRAAAHHDRQRGIPCADGTTRDGGIHIVAVGISDCRRKSPRGHDCRRPHVDDEGVRLEVPDDTLFAQQDLLDRVRIRQHEDYGIGGFRDFTGAAGGPEPTGG